MKTRDKILAALVIVFWGCNFLVIRFGLNGVPSMLLASLRFLFTFFPACFFIARPQLPWTWIMLYGLLLGVGQFGALFLGMEMGVPSSVTSTLAQTQSLFLLLLSRVIFKEPINARQGLGLFVAMVGLGFLTLGGKATTIPLRGLLLVLLSAFLWSISTTVIKTLAKREREAGRELNNLSLIVWSSLFSPIPLFLIGWRIYSLPVMLRALTHIELTSILSLSYLVIVATLFGYTVWGELNSRYPAAKIGPLTLLIPVIGILLGYLVLKERLESLQWVGIFLIIGGLVIISLANRKLAMEETKA